MDHCSWCSTRVLVIITTHCVEVGVIVGLIKAIMFIKVAIKCEAMATCGEWCESSAEITTSCCVVDGVDDTFDGVGVGGAALLLLDCFSC